MDLYLPLNEEINWVIRRKTELCECNPCNCSKDVKERYFNEVKSSLKRHNREYLDHHQSTITAGDRRARKRISSN